MRGNLRPTEAITLRQQQEDNVHLNAQQLESGSCDDLPADREGQQMNGKQAPGAWGRVMPAVQSETMIAT